MLSHLEITNYTGREFIAPVQKMVDVQGVTTHFQPIFSVRQRSIVGLEALARGVSASGGLIPPNTLFKTAQAENLAGAVEDLCRDTAIRNFARVKGRADDLLLFLNLDLAFTPRHEALPAALEALVRGGGGGLHPRNVAIEFLESRLDDIARFGTLATALRQRGFLVVLDDVGAGHSNLDRIPLFRPDIIKLDRSLITGIDHDFYKQEIFKSLVGLSRRIGALVVAEGIETEGEAVTALSLGADLLQGYFLSRPKPVAMFEGPGLNDAAGCIDRLAFTFKTLMVGEINDRKVQHRRFLSVANRIVADLRTTEATQFDGLLGRLIDDNPMVECCYVLDDAGLQVTETILATPRARRGRAARCSGPPRAVATTHSRSTTTSSWTWSSSGTRPTLTCRSRAATSAGPSAPGSGPASTTASTSSASTSAPEAAAPSWAHRGSSGGPAQTTPGAFLHRGGLVRSLMGGDDVSARPRLGCRPLRGARAHGDGARRRHRRG